MEIIGKEKFLGKKDVDKKVGSLNTLTKGKLMIMSKI